jgi:hypothetical protein
MCRTEGGADGSGGEGDADRGDDVGMAFPALLEDSAEDLYETPPAGTSRR